MTKPKEFFIQPDSHIPTWPNGQRHRLLECSEKPMWKNEIHVIEKSAFDELKLENEKWQQRDAERIADLNLEMSKAQRLAKQNEILKTAMESIEKTCEWYAMNHKGPEHEVHHALKVELLDEALRANADAKKIGTAEIKNSVTGEKCPNCGSKDFGIARDMDATRHCGRCQHQWLPEKAGAK